MKKSIAKLLLSASCYMLIFFGTSCKRAGCNEELPIYKHLKIPDWAKEKYAYSGNETLVFYEINGTDTAELSFTPLNNLDTTIESISWYEASNGDWCRGYQTDIDARIDQYYCKERDWYFLAAQNAEVKRIKIEFHQKYNTSYDYNFYKWLDPEYMDSTRIGKPRQGHTYIGDTVVAHLKLRSATYLRAVSQFQIYDNEQGLILWTFTDRPVVFLLKEVLK